MREQKVWQDKQDNFGFSISKEKEMTEIPTEIPNWKKCAKCDKMDCELRFETLEKEWRCRECYFNKQGKNEQKN